MTNLHSIIKIKMKMLFTNLIKSDILLVKDVSMVNIFIH